MTKTRILIFASLTLLLVALLGGRILRQAKSQSPSDVNDTALSVKALVLRPVSYTHTIEGAGVLAGDKEAIVAAETGGRVLEIFVDVGAVVSAGQPLVRLDDELYRLEAERARIAFEKATLDFERIERLHAQKSVSETDLENARLGMKGAEVLYRLAQKTYDNATIRAPFAGTVAARFTEIGQMVERGMPVVQLVDLHTMKLVVPVSEQDVTQLQPGAPAQIVVDALADTAVGYVAAVGSRATTGSRTFPVELRFAGKNGMRSGMFARALIRAGADENALLLPRAAVLSEAGRSVVFLARGGMAEKRIVHVRGAEHDQLVVEGLAAGDTVITTGNQLLSQGSRIHLALVEQVQP